MVIPTYLPAYSRAYVDEHQGMRLRFRIHFPVGCLDPFVDKLAMPACICAGGRPATSDGCQGLGVDGGHWLFSGSRIQHP